MRSRCAVVALCEEAAERGLHAEDGKVAAGYEQRELAGCAVTVRNVRGDLSVRGNTCEWLLPPLEITIERITEDGIAVARIAGRRAPLLRAWRRERDQLFGLAHGQPFQQRVIEEGKDRGVSTN